MALSYGRRKGDNWAQAMIWLQVAMAGTLYAANLVHMGQASAVLGEMRKETSAAKAEAAALRRERKAVGEIARRILDSMTERGFSREGEIVSP